MEISFEDEEDIGSESDGDEMSYTEYNYSSNILSKLDRLRENRSFCDVILQVDDTKFPAHKNVLTAFSSYFENMFQDGKYVESKQTLIPLKDIEVESMRLLLNFAYSGSILITKSNFQSLFSAANLLQVIPVRNYTCKFLARKMNASNCLGIFSLAELYACTELRQKAKNFALRNFRNVSLEKEFLELTAEKLIELTSNDNLKVEKEEYVFLAVKEWFERRPEDRIANFHKVLETVRLPFVDPDFLYDNIQCYPAVNSNPECMKMIEETKWFLLLPKRKEFSCYQSIQRTEIEPKFSVFFGVVRPLRSEESQETQCGCYCFETNNWYNLTSLPCGNMRGICLVACEKNYLYLASGRFLDGSSNRFWRYNPFLNQWREIASMSIRRSSLGLAAMGGCIYAVGGCDEYSSIIDSVERYDPNSNEWSFVQKLKMPISCAAVIVYKNMLYVAGGKGTEEDFTNRVHRYNSETDTWTALPRMSDARRDALCCVLDGYIYIIGGSTAYDKAGSTMLVERFDVKNNRWEYIQSLKKRMKYAGVTVKEKKIYVIGGVNNSVCVQCYDAKLDAWEVISIKKPIKSFRKFVPLKIPQRILTIDDSEESSLSSLRPPSPW